ncbi:aldose 1-epimerase domain protein [Staphylococcus aureus subsp. aureus IS-91]|nr:aldose 1-epimerase domain protein [Staphylococcus aureus subsp. aureus 21318]EHS20751.1 aldose 1-epimerase domain protein [Staphylococcus aureus subsp. aureus IS-91]EYO80335.1 hypothetical protein W198_01499 [Staphylococcus aureus DAR22]CUF61973.1 Aldose 1-epimerase [Staphylococcus aureus]CUF62481.1 Aldose 1-epimerase [Staphylococcus aureus]
MIVEVEHQRQGVDLIKIDNDETKIIFTNYGARVVSWKYHDNNIVLGNVVEADEFYHSNPFKFGASIGRYSGRIDNAKFKLKGKEYQLEKTTVNIIYMVDVMVWTISYLIMKLEMKLLKLKLYLRRC